MTPLWIALILIPAGALLLFFVFKTAWPKPPEDDEDDIWDEPSEEDLEEDLEEGVESEDIADISDGARRPNISRPPITMTSRGMPKKPAAALPAKAGSRVAKTGPVAKTEPVSSSLMTVENLKKISVSKPAVKSGPTVAANGAPIKPKR